MTKKEKAALQGGQAFRDGLPLAHNPFNAAVAADAYGGWRDGWVKAASIGPWPGGSFPSTDEWAAIEIWIEMGVVD